MRDPSERGPKRKGNALFPLGAENAWDENFQREAHVEKSGEPCGIYKRCDILRRQLHSYETFANERSRGITPYRTARKETERRKSASRKKHSWATPLSLAHVAGDCAGKWWV